MRHAIAAILTALLPVTADAACKGATFLFCPVGNGDQLEVCITDGAFTYAFGPQGAPELQLSVPMAAGTVTPWPGIGRAIWSSVTFTNGGYAYEAWSSVERSPDGGPAEGGVTVMRGQQTLATLTCLPGTVTSAAFVLEDAMASANYCWDFDNLRWLPGTCN